MQSNEREDETLKILNKVVECTKPFWIPAKIYVEEYYTVLWVFQTRCEFRMQN